jgi:hypothetical protein
MNKNTMQPFESGDIFLGLTLLNDPDDDHAGDGFIARYGKELPTTPKNLTTTKTTTP